MRPWPLAALAAAVCAAATTTLIAAAPAISPAAPDTIRLAVGSQEVDGTVYRPHVGRVTRLLIDGERVDTTAVWLNTLEIGDSVGRAVHRWHTGGWSGQPGGKRNRFDLWSTFDARTLALLGWHLKGGAGFEARIAADGARVRGSLKPPTEAAPQVVDFTLSEPGFASGAADLIPYAVGLRDGLTVSMPLWTPPGRTVARETWTVVRREPVTFGGRQVPSWVMEHFAEGSTTAKGRIWFVDEPPYVVRWDVFNEDGTLVRMIGEPGG